MKFLFSFLVAGAFSLSFETHESRSMLNHMKCSQNSDCVGIEKCVQSLNGYGVC